MNEAAPAPPASQPLAGLHYHLEGYVCAGQVKPSPFEAWVTFALILQRRPKGCRFAVAQLVPVFSYHPAGPYLCWDLMDDTLEAARRAPAAAGLVTPPWPKWQGESPDALIMKAIALYDRE